MTIDYATDPGVWPKIDRGGHLRNADGDALVTVNGRNRIYRGGSDLWPFDGPYRGDPIHGDRGTHVHDICDLADRGAKLGPDFIAHGESLGIGWQLQAYIYARWVVFLKAHGLTVTHVEQIVVNDRHMVASNVDRVVACPDGMSRILDIKSAAKVDKHAYLLQLACYADAGTVPYDPTTGERGEWGDGVGLAEPTIDAERAYIAHFPIAAAIKAASRDEWLDWSLIEVELAAGHVLLDRLAELAATDVTDAFSQPIAAPDDLPASVEQRATDAERTANAPASVANLEESVAAVTVEFDTSGFMAAVEKMTTSLDEQRQRYRALSEGDKAAVARYWEANGTDLADADQIAESIDAVVNFADVATSAPPKAPPAPRPAATLPTSPDEGDDVDDAAVEQVKASYGKLDEAARSWVNAIVTDAKRAGLDFRLKDRPTSRRWHLLAALVILADNGFDNDDAVRGSLAGVIGAELADAKAFNLGQLVGACDAVEANRFRDVAYALVGGEASMRFTDAGRCRVAVAA